MATRSTIALEYADGTVEQIYCHWDGYLDHNGRILQEHYIDPFKVRNLMDLGDVSSLGKDIMPEPYREHTFNKPQEGVTVFYGRDRGETGVGSRKFKDYADYRKNSQGEEYNYILRQVDGKAVWFVEFYGEFDGPLVNAFEFEAHE